MELLTRTGSVKMIKRAADKQLRLTLRIQKRNIFCELFCQEEMFSFFLQFPHLQNLSAKVGSPTPIFSQNIRKIYHIYENWVRLIPNSSDHEPDEIDDIGFMCSWKPRFRPSPQDEKLRTYFFSETFSFSIFQNIKMKITLQKDSFLVHSSAFTVLKAIMHSLPLPFSNSHCSFSYCFFYM